jgi:protein TonB
MNQAARLSHSVLRDEPWWRLAWIAPLALALWAGLLFAFSILLERTAAPPPENAPVEARIVEIPPAAGLGSSPAPAPAIKTAPRPKSAPKPFVPPRPRLAKPRPAARLEPPSSSGTAKPEAAPPIAAPSQAPAGATTSGESGASADRDGLGTRGTDNAGARATYAPVPEIPDELRANALEAVAVAHFRIDPWGNAQVSLSQPTENPRLNQILLDALKQWRFDPATRGGVAIGSEFDIRIPITVQ